MKVLASCFLIAIVVCQAGCSALDREGSSETTSNPTIFGTAEDKEAIETAYQNWYTAWETKDYKLASQDYSDDAFWVNAFGIKRSGRVEIENTLKEVFAMDFVMTGKSKTVEKTIRFIRPDVALVESRIEREGQETRSREQLGTRNTTHLRVFVKSDGKWHIISHLISDARSPQNREH